MSNRFALLIADGLTSSFFCAADAGYRPTTLVFVCCAGGFGALKITFLSGAFFGREVGACPRTQTAHAGVDGGRTLYIFTVAAYSEVLGTEFCQGLIALPTIVTTGSPNAGFCTDIVDAVQAVSHHDTVILDAVIG